MNALGDTDTDKVGREGMINVFFKKGCVGSVSSFVGFNE